MKSYHMSMSAGLGGGSTLPHSLNAVAMSGEIGFVGTVPGGSSTIDANEVFASGATEGRSFGKIVIRVAA